MSLESLKNRRNNAKSSVIDELNKFKNKKPRVEDTRWWSPKPDKQGNAFAIIRFLPAIESDNLNFPFVKIWDHGFQGPTGKWYIENSLRSIDMPDPVAELNTKLWNSGLESNKELVRKRRQRPHYITNIYVVKDSLHPENEGRVFLYKLGPEVFEKVESSIIPPKNEFEEPKEPVYVYDFWEGANFRLRLKKGATGRPTYADSSFDDVSPLFKNKKGEADEDKISEVYSQIYSLKPFKDPNGVDPSGERYYKTYDELKEKLYRVLELSLSENSDSMTETSATKNNKLSRSNEDDDNNEEDDDLGSLVSDEIDDEDDEILKHFESLVESDD